MGSTAQTIRTRPCETTFGSRLDEIRRARGQTLELFALHVRVSQRTLENWLSDEFEPLLGYAYKAACAVGYDVEDLADPELVVLPEPRRSDAPGSWSFNFKAGCVTAWGPSLRTAILADGRDFTTFAKDLGISRVAVGNWVVGRTEPRLTTAMRAADDLGLSLHGLCEGRFVRRSK